MYISTCLLDERKTTTTDYTTATDYEYYVKMGGDMQRDHHTKVMKRKDVKERQKLMLRKRSTCKSREKRRGRVTKLSRRNGRINIQQQERLYEVTVKNGNLHSIPRRKSLLNHRWERPDLCTPADRVVLLEPYKELLEHTVQLC